MPDNVVRMGDPARLEHLETIIGRGQRTFYEVGSALREIREDRLYKYKNGGEYKTFDAYCKSVWGWGRHYANRSIAATEAMDVLVPMGTKIEDLSERIVRPLTKLDDPAEQLQCYQAAQSLADMNGKPVTEKFVAQAVREFIGESEESDTDRFSPIIKPMDNWNFSPVIYEKVRFEGNGDGAESHGYIPGEVYANVLWYYAKPGDVVVEPMAGSGLIWKVWEDRQRWLKGWPGLDRGGFSENDEPLTIQTFDLNPRGPYAHLIGQHDLSAGFPVDHADYIFMDVPYFAIVNGQYSTKGQDLANMDERQWEQAMNAVARSCASGQSQGKLCSVMVPNWRNLDSGKIVLAPRIVQRVFEANGYALHDVVYSSRRIQQQQNFGMAMANNKAKRSRVMLTDIAEILTFRKN